MKKAILLISTCFLLSFLSVSAQTPFTSHNMTASIVASPVTGSYSKSLRVRFEIQNDSVTLVDSFLTTQSLTNQFMHSDIQNPEIHIDYNWSNAVSCTPGPGLPDSIIVYAFKLFHKDSFQHKTIHYKHKNYELTNTGSGNWIFNPNQNPLPESLYIQSIADNGNGSISSIIAHNPPKIYLSGDTIIASVLIFHTATAGQIFKEEIYSVPDSFKLQVTDVSCGNIHPTANNFYYYKIYLGDTNTTNTLDVQIPYYGNTNTWFHYDNSNNSILTKIVSPLPAIGLQLEVAKSATANKLYWSTISEKNISHYKIMKSNNGIDFERIGTLAAKGNSDTPTAYFFDDHNIDEQLNTYYRIDLVDMDQQKTHSNVVFLAAKEKEELLIFPNPMNHQLVISNLNTHDYKLQMATTDGRVLFDELLATKKKEHRIDLSSYPKGMYLINLQNLETGINTTRKIIKE